MTAAVRSPTGRKHAPGKGLLYPIIGLGICVAFIYLYANSTVGPSAPPKEMGFVTRNGTHLHVDGGAPFYVNGWNSYWLMDQSVDDRTRHRVTDVLATGRKLGLTVCRTWAFNDGAYNALQLSLGRFDERVFKALDRVLVEARKNGVRLLLCLANNLQAFGGKTQYVKWAWEDGIGLSASNDSFFFDPSIRSYFKVYLKTLLTRKNHLTGIEYRDDPTIFAWELINEPRCLSDRTGDTLQEWLEEMVGYIKSIDKKHLLTVGLEGFYGPSSSQEKQMVNPSDWEGTLGTDFIRNSKIQGIDFASVHVYPDQWFEKRGYSLDEKIKYVKKWVNSHIDDGDKELKKPVVFTEFGLSSKNRDFDPSHREIFYKVMFDMIYECARKRNSGVGSLIWQMMVGGMEQYSDDYSIVPEDRPTLYAVIKEQSCRLTALRNGIDWTDEKSRKLC